MKDMRETIKESLADAGLGPGRIDRAMQGSSLFGTSGILNSIELVEFIAALSERTGVETFDFMRAFERGEMSAFESVSTLSSFLSGQAPRVVAG